MIRDKAKKIPKKEIFRFYIVERDPNPAYRLFACDFEEETDAWI